jgi:hypothetical protein
VTPPHPDAGGAPEPTPAAEAEPLLGPLLEALLQVRTRPAGCAFDQAVAGAVAAGRLAPELAHELRFWQRAAEHEVTDYLLAVLPAVLPVALAAVAAATDHAAATADAAAAVWAAQHAERGRPSAMPARQEIMDQRPDAPEATQAVVSAPDVIVMQATMEPHPADAVDHEDAVDQDAADQDAVDQDAADQEVADDDVGPTIANPHARRRMFVAGLTSSA